VISLYDTSLPVPRPPTAPGLCTRRRRRRATSSWLPDSWRRLRGKVAAIRGNSRRGQFSSPAGIVAPLEASSQFAGRHDAGLITIPGPQVQLLPSACITRLSAQRTPVGSRRLSKSAGAVDTLAIRAVAAIPPWRRSKTPRAMHRRPSTLHRWGRPTPASATQSGRAASSACWGRME
jgi:hypothetical protein